MPSLPCYLAGDDPKILLNFLNESAEISFVVPAGARRWRTVLDIPELNPGRQFLWHMPGGPLSMIRGGNEPEEPILNPESGFWSQSADQPYFGPTATNVIWLDFRPVIYDKETGAPNVNLSDFSWIGNRYSAIGHPASTATERWWKLLKRVVQKHAVKVPRGGPGQPYPVDTFAFPDAQRLFAEGAKGIINPQPIR